MKSFSIQKSSNKPPNVFVAPALKSPTKQIFGDCSSSHNCLNLPRYAKNSSVLALLQYGRYTLIEHRHIEQTAYWAVSAEKKKRSYLFFLKILHLLEQAHRLLEQLDVQQWPCCRPSNQKWSETIKNRPVLLCWRGAWVNSVHHNSYCAIHYDTNIAKIQ